MQKSGNKRIVAASPVDPSEQVGVKRKTIERSVVSPGSVQNSQPPIVVELHVPGIREKELALGQPGQSIKTKRQHDDKKTACDETIFLSE